MAEPVAQAAQVPIPPPRLSQEVLQVVPAAPVVTEVLAPVQPSVVVLGVMEDLAPLATTHQALQPGLTASTVV